MPKQKIIQKNILDDSQKVWLLIADNLSNYMYETFLNSERREGTIARPELAMRDTYEVVMWLTQKINASPEDIYNYLKNHYREHRLSMHPGIGKQFIESSWAIIKFTDKIPRN